MNELKVGDVIYRVQYGKVVGKITIDRVTKTQAFSKDSKFKRNFMSSVTTIPRETGFGITSYYLETEKLKNEYKMNVLKKRVSLLKVGNLTESQLVRIYNILQEK